MSSNKTHISKPALAIIQGSSQERTDFLIMDNPEVVHLVMAPLGTRPGSLLPIQMVTILALHPNSSVAIGLSNFRDHIRSVRRKRPMAARLPCRVQCKAALTYRGPVLT
jgi:hypothetical protein